MSEDKEDSPRASSQEPVYTEEEWEAVRDGLRRHDEEKLAGIRCAICGHNYLVEESHYKFCPDCGNIGPGHPDAELKDIE